MCCASPCDSPDSFEGVALACPGSATDVIRGLGRRPWCALGMLAGSKQGLARGWWYVGRTTADLDVRLLVSSGMLEFYGAADAW